ncbi:MAG: DUF951 domain-containing protein [Clostridia bacterium]|nr:DUF951 domain-containing protein [Clostridia bacterium]
MQILKLLPDMVVELKKPHPCGKRDFRIVRVGSVCRIVCLSCGRDLEIDRIKLEKAIKNITSNVAQKD